DATERAIVIAGSGRPWVLGPTERQAPISRACPWRLGRSPLENDRKSPISSAHAVPIYLVGLRRSLVRYSTGPGAYAFECAGGSDAGRVTYKCSYRAFAIALGSPRAGPRS